MSIGSQKKTFKVIVLGDSNVGKTSLLYRYCHREVAESSAPTIGLDYFNAIVEVEGQRLEVGNIPYINYN